MEGGCGPPGRCTSRQPLDRQVWATRGATAGSTPGAAPVPFSGFCNNSDDAFNDINSDNETGDNGRPVSHGVQTPLVCSR